MENCSLSVGIYAERSQKTVCRICLRVCAALRIEDFPTFGKRCSCHLRGELIRSYSASLIDLGADGVWKCSAVWLHIRDEAKKRWFNSSGLVSICANSHTCKILNRNQTFLFLSLEKQYKLHAFTFGAHQYSVSLTLTICCQFQTRVMCLCCPAQCFYVLVGSPHLVTHCLTHGGVNRQGQEDEPLPRQAVS